MILIIILAIVVSTTIICLIVLIGRKQRDFRKNQIAEMMLKCREEQHYKPNVTEGITTSIDPNNILPDHPANRRTQHTSATSNKIGETYRINYKARDGEITRRTITIKKIYRENHTNYIRAYCYLRCDERTFKLERITGYITNTQTGELLDPDELNPLKNKTIIPVEKTKSAMHYEIYRHEDGWFIHHPNEKVSRKADREALGLTAYRYQIDAYRSAINKTIESGADTLCLYVYGKYSPSKKPDNSDKIDIIQIDISTPEGIEKKKWINNL